MRTLITVAMLLAAAGIAGAQERLADQLKKGIVQEETGQSPEKAIQAYKAILAQFDEERKVAATALFRLAECYRKAGMRPEAQTAYQRVVREFGDQTAIADSSRRQLMETYGVSDPRGARESQDLLKAQQELAAARQALSEAQARQMLGSRTLSNLSDEPVRMTSIEELKLELAMLERRMADIKAKVEVGTAPKSALDEMMFQYQKDVLRYQQLMAERETVEKDRQAALTFKEQALKSIEAEMKLVEQQLQTMQKKVETGLMSPADPQILQLQRDLLALQRKADEIRAGIRR